MTALQAAKMVTVITREDVNRAGAASVNDLLKLATGVDVRQRGGFGVQTDISINGGTFDQMAIFLNGINLSNPQTGHNAADFPVNLSDIERIEIYEGAAARVFGSAAFNGAVNIVTKQHTDSEIQIGLQGGSFGTFGSDGSIAINSKKIYNRMSGRAQAPPATLTCSGRPVFHQKTMGPAPSMLRLIPINMKKHDVSSPQ